MAEPALEEEQNWEQLMLVYLRRRWRRNRLKLLDAPQIVIDADDIYRKSWQDLKSALQADFGSQLTDPRTVEFLQQRYTEIAERIGYAEASLRAQDLGAPCESCAYNKETTEKDTDEIEERMPLREILRRGCSTTCALTSTTENCGRWTLRIESCATFKVKRYLAVEYEETDESIRTARRGALETFTEQFDTWLRELSVSEQLLD